MSYIVMDVQRKRKYVFLFLLHCSMLTAEMSHNWQIQPQNTFLALAFPFLINTSCHSHKGKKVILGFCLFFVGNIVWGRFLFHLCFVLSCRGDNACAVVSEAATDILSVIKTPVCCVSRSIYLVSLISCFPSPPKQCVVVVKVQSKRSE